ncbi:hypothetical protein [Nocardioides xinjiangensis]|uniref:hypothetical protein n=1 Tax=Nocardioides xinjiangensis TaxID=2817376 RepID=UPI0027DC96DF|nr:hypothetical protein [Nocardioides sp. SYSU D00514]
MAVPPPPLPTLQAPVDRHTHVVLRAAVVELVAAEQRRRFPTAVHAGAPGRCLRHVDDPPSDAGLRADLALALLRGAATLTPRPLLWLTRPGELSPHDEDLRWVGPAAWAGRALGLDVGLVVVTRRGWFDPVSDVRREWRRLRPPPTTR